MTFDASLGPLITVIRSAVTRGVTQVVANQSPPPRFWGPCGSIYRGGKGRHYNAINTPNHLLRQ
jgi:hypothetical protein